MATTDKFIVQMVVDVLDKATTELKNIAGGTEDIVEAQRAVVQAENAATIAAKRLSKAQRELADNTDPKKQRQLEDAVIDAKKALDGMGDSTKKAGMSLTDLKSGFDMAMQAGQAFVGVFKTTLDLARQAGEIERAERAFVNLSGGAEQAAANLEAMKQASAGTLAEVDALSQGSKLLAMNIVTNADEMGQFTEMASRLGSAMGLTTTEAFENLAATIANKSFPRLDQMGIAADRVRGEMNRLKEAGMGADEAFRTAVFSEGAVTMERLGDRVRDTATAVEELDVAFAEMKQDTLELLAPALKNVADGLRVIITLQKRVREARKENAAAVLASAETYEEYVRTLAKSKGGTDEMIDSWLEGGKTIHDLAKEMDMMNAAMWAGTKTTDGWSHGMLDVVAVAEDAAAPLDEVTKRQILLNRAFGNGTIDAEELRAGMAELAPSIDAVAEADSRAADMMVRVRDARRKAAEALVEENVALGDSFTAALESEEAEVNLASALMESADAAGASATTLALLAAATGEYTDAQIEAALKAAAFESKVEELGGEIANGNLTIDEALTKLETYKQRLENIGEAQIFELELPPSSAEVEERIKGLLPDGELGSALGEPRDIEITSNAEEEETKFQDLAEAMVDVHDTMIEISEDKLDIKVNQRELDLAYQKALALERLLGRIGDMNITIPPPPIPEFNP